MNRRYALLSFAAGLFSRAGRAQQANPEKNPLKSLMLSVPGVSKQWIQVELGDHLGIQRTPEGRYVLNAKSPLSDVSVRDSGAVGDGSHDDTQAFLAAIAALSSPGGGTVWVPPGRYRITAPIAWSDKRISLIGSGAGIPPGSGSVIQAEPGITAIHVQNGQTGHGANCLIRGLHLVGSPQGAAADGILIQASGTQIEDVVIQHFSGNGLHIESGISRAAAPINANHCRIAHVRVAQNGSHGFFVEGVDSNAGSFVGIDATENAGAGIFDNSFLGNSYFAPHCSGNGKRSLTPDYVIGQLSRGNMIIGAYNETRADGIPGMLIQGAGRNFIHFSTQENQIVDHARAENLIISNAGGLHFNRLAVGEKQSASAVFSPGVIQLLRGQKLQVQSPAAHSNWSIAATDASHLRIDSPQHGVFSVPNGIATFTKNGAISDADFGSNLPDGVLAVDTANGRLYVRTRDGWKSVLLSSIAPV